MTDLHAQIMNIQISRDIEVSSGPLMAYKQGFRDARHAAAELAASLTQPSPSPSTQMIFTQEEYDNALFASCHDKRKGEYYVMRIIKLLPNAFGVSVLTEIAYPEENLLSITCFREGVTLYRTEGEVLQAQEIEKALKIKKDEESSHD